MKYWTHERYKPKNWQGQEATWKQYKYNGHRFTVYKQKNGKLIGFERKVVPELEMTVKRPKIVEYEWWKQLDATMPPMSSIDGELYVSHGNAGDAAHAIAECLSNLEYKPFAVPWWEGRDLTHEKNLIDVIYNILKPRGIDYASTFFVREHDTEELLLQDARDLNIEGWVLKNYNYDEWWKVKPTKTIDAIVTGFKDGDGKYLGLVGSLIVSAWVDGVYREIARVSGMDEDTRYDIDEKNDLGRVVEVEYQEMGNGGKLIHPRFVRWRDDKPSEECKYKRSEL